MDEAAEACGLDPLEFRLRNYAETDPASGKPFSSKALRECYAQGAERFGWAGRPLAPGQMRDADGRLVGWGMGTALFPAPMFRAEARATLRADGTALVETSAVDMGQGAWTALAQIAADGLGLPVDRVEFRAGHSDHPGRAASPAARATPPPRAARCSAPGPTWSPGSPISPPAIRRRRCSAPATPASRRATAACTTAATPSRHESYADILARAGLSTLEGTGAGARDQAHAEARAMFSHGAVFAEVHVDPDLGQMRVSRLVGAFAAGRIINPHLARSQLIGGMIWGLSFALHEEALHDPRTGRSMNADLAGYHVPVNADAPSVEALLVHEDDPYVNPLGVKGVGEIGITGTVGAIANAVWHATGVRPRRFPIRIEELLPS